MRENIAATDLAISETDLAAIKQAFADIDVEGERYPAQSMATTGR